MTYSTLKVLGKINNEKFTVCLCELRSAVNKATHAFVQHVLTHQLYDALTRTARQRVVAVATERFYPVIPQPAWGDRR